MPLEQHQGQGSAPSFNFPTEHFTPSWYPEPPMAGSFDLSPSVGGIMGPPADFRTDAWSRNPIVIIPYYSGSGCLTVAKRARFPTFPLVLVCKRLCIGKKWVSPSWILCHSRILRLKRELQTPSQRHTSPPRQGKHQRSGLPK